MLDWEDEIEVVRCLMEMGWIKRRLEPLDIVVMRWLWMGDTRPLAWAMRKGKPLSKAVLLAVGMMLDHEPRIPYRLEIFKQDGKRGNAKKPANLMRDVELSSTVAGLRDRVGATYDATIREIAKVYGVSESTVRDAVTQHKQSPD